MNPCRPLCSSDPRASNFSVRESKSTFVCSDGESPPLNKLVRSGAEGLRLFEGSRSVKRPADLAKSRLNNVNGNVEASVKDVGARINRQLNKKLICSGTSRLDNASNCRR